MFNPFFPPTTRPVWVFVAFLLVLGISDIVLVRWLRVGRRGWKYLDYVWLGFGVLGLIGSAAEARRAVASAQIGFANDHKASSYDLLRAEAGFVSGGAVCRRFERDEWSPSNLPEIQAEYDRVCEYGKQLKARLPAEPPQQLDVTPFRNRPKVGDGMLSQIYAELDSAVLRYQGVETRVAEVLTAAERSEADVTWSILSPLLLAVALALRITKVTGELKLGA
jgi:hypothetical protein